MSSSSNNDSPRIGRQSPIRALLTLVALTVVFLAALVGPTVPGIAVTHTGPGDVDIFRSVVSRLRGGEPYYPTIGDEMRRGNYPTAQAFNWRTPLLFASLSSVPETVGQAVWILVGIVVCGATLLVTARQPLPVVVTAVLMQVGAITAMDPPAAVLMGEAWAGALIGLSVCAYLRGYLGVGVLLGLLALFARELAAPYCVVCTLTALVNRRWREVAAWVAGAAVYAAYYGWHLIAVWRHQLPTDLAHGASWVQFGGLVFLLVTIRFNRWLHIAPKAVAALGLTLVVAGTASPLTPLHVRLTSAVYLGGFLIAGQTFNEYWGLIAWPTWALACGYGAQAIADTSRVASTPFWHHLSWPWKAPVQ